MPALTDPRRRAWRAMLSALAGGGLTAAGLGGPLSAAALGAEAPAASPTPGEGAATPPVTASTPVATPATPTPSASDQTTTSTPTSSQPAPATGASGSGSASPPASAPAPAEVPTVVLQRKQKTTPGRNASRSVSATAPGSSGAQPATNGASTSKSGAASGPSNVALPPQLVAAQAKALAAELAGSAASEQALSFYRIPLFLLPIYQAAAVQYGVPWQILAAINEIETDYGSDQSVSTAGAVGWMQFMPATWLQYGVDALNAGYADPYNPVDAIFAAARYLRAAGAESNLRGAILAYNHSEEYADSVLLRAKLIATYPKSVIATLTGLVDARLPVTGKRVAWGPLLSAVPPSSATANAAAAPSAAASAAGPTTLPSATPAGSGAATVPLGPSASGPSGSGSSPAPGAGSAQATPGSTAPPSPAVAAALATGKAGAEARPQFVDLMSSPNAAVVAVQDGRIVQLGSSRKLGKYVILRDVYGDVFTYAGLGSIAPTYRLPKALGATAKAPVAQPAEGHEPAPAQPASAGRQLPLTLRVKTPAKPDPSEVAAARSAQEASSSGAEATPAATGKVRLFAHPGNPDALAAARVARERSTRAGLHASGVDRPLPLRRGSVIAQGTVLGHVRVPLGAKDGHLRFAVRPAGDSRTIDPQAILENWMQLDTALHPQGAKGDPSLLGATASAVFLLSKSDLEREILSDPGIVMSACSRHEVAAGAIDKRVLAVLGFLSRSGLKPTVAALRCGAGAYAVSGYVSSAHIGDGLAISQINGIPIAGHQGAGSITDTTIRTLLTLQGEFVPRQIVSLMRYPGAPSTLARADHGGYIEVVFAPAAKRGAAAKVTATKARTTAAHSASADQTAPSPVVVSGDLSAAQWDTLITRVAGLPAPTVRFKPSSSAIPDATSPTVPQAAKGSGSGKK
jgi:soluble lytic murein transglycosylase-like protein